MAPFAYAHDLVPGGPKLECEDSSVQNVHDYALSAAGFVTTVLDGGLILNCDGSSIPLVGGDAHSEFGIGGVRLVAGANALSCGSTPPHHPVMPTVRLEDHFLGGAVDFTVGVDNSPGGDGCGNGIIGDPEDNWIDKAAAPMGSVTNSVSVPFAPGLDGTYWVFVASTGNAVVTTGHIYTDEGAPPTPPTPPPGNPLVRAVGTGFYKASAGSNVTFQPFHPAIGCTITTSLLTGTITCDDPVARCATPGIGVTATAGTITGMTKCVGSPEVHVTATASASGPGRDANAAAGLFFFPWTCTVTFSPGATGAGACDAPDP